MLKHFLKAMAFGIWVNLHKVLSVIFKIALLVCAFVVPSSIALAFTERGTVACLLLAIFLYGLEIFLLVTGKRAFKAAKYADEHNCTIQVAWEATKPEPSYSYDDWD